MLNSIVQRVRRFFSPREIHLGKIVGSNNANTAEWQLHGLSAAMARTNFVVGLRISGFIVLTDKPFSTELLRELIALEENRLPVEGPVEEVDLKTVQDGIDEILFWSTGGSALRDPRSNALRSIFWDIVFGALPDAPKKYFIHRPELGTYFADAPLGWDYTYIIRAGVYGIVLAGFGSD